MKYRTKGLDVYIRRLENLENPSKFLVALDDAITEGGKIVEKVTRDEIEALPVDDRRTVPKGELRKGLRTIQKKTLLNSFGISPIQEKRDSYDKKTGVARGLNIFGQPNVTVARMLENGTSWMQKNPVFSRASRKARKGCLEAMQESLDRSYKKLMI